MKYNIIVSDDVHVQLELQVEWIKRFNKKRAALFIDDYQAALKFLQKYPYCNPVKSGSYRIIQLQHFKYVLVYKIYSKDIVIARLVHATSGFERKFG